jgi:Family of unknown function (DUF6056)
LLVTLSTVPNLFQSFFWQDGMVNYSLPLIGLTYCCGIVIHAWLEGANTLVASIGIFLLAFISGGFTEASVVMEIALFALALLLTLTCRDKATRLRLIAILSAALLGALLAVLVVYIAPGNQLRLQTAGSSSGHPGLLRITTFSMRNMVYIYGKFFLLTPIWALVSITLPFIAGWLFSPLPSNQPKQVNLQSLWEQSWFRSIIFIGVAGLILVTAACVPVVYALNAYPEDRTIIIPQFVVVISVVFISALLGTGLHQLGWLPDIVKKRVVDPVLIIGMLVIILISTGLTIRRISNQLPIYHSYQELWDDRASTIHQAIQAGESSITVPGRYSLFGVADLTDDPNNWVNRCMANYYGLSEIIGR